MSFASERAEGDWAEALAEGRLKCQTCRGAGWVVRGKVDPTNDPTYIRCPYCNPDSSRYVPRPGAPPDPRKVA